MRATLSFYRSIAAGVVLAASVSLSGSCSAQQWSGAYVTGFGEYASGSSSQHDNGFSLAPPVNPGCPEGEVMDEGGDCVFPEVRKGDGHYNLSGALGGGGAGYNLQYGRFVYGIEADISGGRISGSSAFCGTPAHSCGTSIDALGEVKGRLGYAFDAFMPFVAGGLAVENIHAYDGLTGASGTKALAGYSVGAGVEYKITPQICLRAEYIHTEVGSSYLYQIVPGVPERVSARTEAVRVGLNYYFTPAVAPVIARY